MSCIALDADSRLDPSVASYTALFYSNRHLIRGTVEWSARQNYVDSTKEIGDRPLSTARRFGTTDTVG